MERTKLVRGLRIAWSVWWGILCLLLIALWPQSYRWLDGVSMPISTARKIAIWSGGGRVEFQMADYGGPSSPSSPSSPLSIVRVSRAAVRDYAKAVGMKSETRYFGRTQFGFLLPSWLLVVVTITLAAAPWMRWKFSLRTLLIATTLIAVVLGLVVWSSS